MRRTIARYLIFALIQTLRMTSITVKKRFPTLAHLCEAGIITENEQKIVEGLDDKCIQVELTHLQNQNPIKLLAASEILAFIGLGRGRGDQSKEGGRDQG